ncbi:MAG: response regulator [Deltaproteobacteria bacterium]|nr:response regulator [Deltaproteobacteria bacterium]
MPSKKILLIDNDIEYQALVSEALETANYRINTSLDGESGFQLAKKDRPDLVIISIELEDSNGYLVSKRFREDEGLKNIPVILISRDAKPKDFEQHRKLKIRADEYMLKPFSGEVLLSKVQNLIGFHITEKEFELMQDHLNSMIQEKIVLDDRISTLEKENSDLRAQDRGIKVMQQEVQAAKGKEAQLIRQLNESKEHTKAIDKWLTEANDNAERLQKENDRLKKENAAARAELENTRRQIGELTAAVNELQSKLKGCGMDAERIKDLLDRAAGALSKG